MLKNQTVTVLPSMQTQMQEWSQSLWIVTLILIVGAWSCI